MMGGMHLEKMTDKEVLRVPKHKLEGMGQLYGFLQAEGFEKVGDLDLPLAYLFEWSWSDRMSHIEWTLKTKTYY